MLRAATVWLVALCLSSVYLAHGLGQTELKSGEQYFIRLAKNIECGYIYTGLAFNNRTCESQSTATVRSATGPRLRSGSASLSHYEEWIVKIDYAAADGSFYLARIANTYDGKYGVIRCKGHLSAHETAKCKAGAKAANVFISDRHIQVWKTVPTGGSYQIMHNSRQPGCLRYLGLRLSYKNCHNATVGLFAKDNGTGAQRWKFVPVNPGTSRQESSPAPSPSPSPFPSPLAPRPIAPGSPGGLNNIYISDTKWYVTWFDGTPGTPEETYTIKCVKRFDSCSAPPIGTPITNLPRGTEKGMIIDLTPDTELSCYIIAENSAGYACSGPDYVLTMPEYSAPPTPSLLRYVLFPWNTSVDDYITYPSTSSCFNAAILSAPNSVLDIKNNGQGKSLNFYTQATTASDVIATSQYMFMLLTFNKTASITQFGFEVNLKNPAGDNGLVIINQLKDQHGVLISPPKVYDNVDLSNTNTWTQLKFDVDFTRPYSSMFLYIGAWTPCFMSTPVEIRNFYVDGKCIGGPINTLPPPG